MKLATRKSQSRDGELLVVGRQGNQAIVATDIAPTLQHAMDNWGDCELELKRMYADLCEGKLDESFAFDPTMCESPLPRAYQWADGSAYVNHVELVRKARGAAMPESFWADPLLYQGGSDGFLGPCDPIQHFGEELGLDMEAEVAVITGDVPMGADEGLALESIRLVMLVNDVSLRALIPSEIGKGFGFFQSKPASAFSPLAITPDELGDHWKDGKVCLPLHTWLNDDRIGSPNAGDDMTFNFPQLICHATKTRSISAGTIIGSGTVSNVDRAKGSSCIAEIRMLEALETGEPKTPFLRNGDCVKIEMFDDVGESVFGAINQTVVMTC